MNTKNYLTEFKARFLETRIQVPPMDYRTSDIVNNGSNGEQGTQ